MKKRGQISLEFIIIFGVTTMVVIALIGISFYYSRQVEDTINTNQINEIAKAIVDVAESMYYFGEPSKTTLKVYIPKGIKEITFDTNEINFRVKVKDGETDIFYPSPIPLQGIMSTGYGFRYIKIEAREGYVWINGTNT